MRPPRSLGRAWFWSSITRPASWHIKKTLFRFTSWQRAHSHSSIFRIDADGRTTAALTRMSTRPHSARVVSMRVTHWNLLAVSAAMSSAWPPAVRSSAANRAIRSGFRSLTATRAPAAASARATAAPAACPAPVTMATLLFRSRVLIKG